MTLDFPTALETGRRILPSASVIIPTKNRREDLTLAVESVLRQTCLPQELIVIDQSEALDSMASVQRVYGAAPPGVRSNMKLMYVRDPAIPGSAVARNAGIEQATTEVLIFLDDDVVLEAEFIEQLLCVYVADAEVSGVSGVVTNYRRPPLPRFLFTTLFKRGPFRDERQPIYWNADALRRSNPIRVGKFGAGGMSLRTCVLATARFDSTLTGVPGGEDVDLCCRLSGRKLVITPAARYLHKSSPRNRVSEYWLQAEVRKEYYVYLKNWRAGIRNRLCYEWLNMGYAAAALAACLKRLSLEPWRAFRTGARQADMLATRAGAAGVRTPVPARDSA